MEAKKTGAPGADRPRGPRRGPGPGGGGRGRPRQSGDRGEREREFDQQTLDLARVTRVTKGGKRMRFRAALVIGDRKGRVGFGVAKGIDVQASMQKALHQAKKNLVELALVHGTFPHAAMGHFGSADVLIMPAPKGTGLKSGGAVRMMLELAGVGDAVSKILGSTNKINVAKATFAALAKMRVPEGTLTDADRATTERKEKRDEAARKVTKKKEDEVAPMSEPVSLPIVE